MQHKILIAEDNVEISDTMRNYLLRAGYAVYQAFDGGTAVNMAKKLEPDLIFLDIMMPIKDGYTVCEEIRKTKNIPVIVVSAKAAEEDKERLFDLGADDYITKPFSYKEMVMRAGAQLRRYFGMRAETSGERHYGKLTICTERFEAKANGNPLNLTAKEFKLLDILTHNANQIFGKQKLIDEVWGIDEYIDENTVAVTVARLREKLLKESVENVVTVWGLGYKWQD